ncbi:hypothetical protein C8J56DRAFT_881448 [Mycena floridula]|nr:hypothetical protein C8J56DRAFT_881448 [Mycena floridula]
MTKSTEVKKQKLKQLQNQRRSVRLGTANVVQNPLNTSSQTSPGNSGTSNPGMTFGSIPSMTHLYQTPEGGARRVFSTAVSSLDTLTPSPVADQSNQQNPFVDRVGMTRSPTVTEPPGYESRRPSGQRMEYLYVPGQGFVAQNPESAPENPNDNEIRVQQPVAPRTSDIEDNESVREMTESERGRRRAGKSRHHGADTDDDDIEDPDIQQAILDNLPLMNEPEVMNQVPADTNELNRTFLPPSASEDLNALFHRAASIVTSTIGGNNITLNQVNAINTMAAQFAYNLDAAVAKLMSPRLTGETNEQYEARMNAQFRFIHANENDNPRSERQTIETSQSRSTVHFSPSTRGGEPDYRNETRPEPITVSSIRGTPENAQRIWKDRVAIQRMVNGEMREKGVSAYPDQGISFDAAGNPYDRLNSVNQTNDNQIQNDPPQRGNNRADQIQGHSRDNGTSPPSNRHYDPRGPREPPLTEWFLA